MKRIIQLPNYAIMPAYGTIVRIECAKGVGITPEQIIGLVPARPELFDCRPEECCVKVFSTDKNSFLFRSLSQPAYVLEKQQTNGSYASVGSGALTLFNQGFMPAQPKYSGAVINWATVFSSNGSGTYRLKAGTTPNASYSLPFCLYEYSCEAANESVYIESELQGTVTSVTNPAIEYELPQIWLDYNRYEAKFGDHSTNFEVTNVAYAFGKTIAQQKTHRAGSVHEYSLRVFQISAEMVKRLCEYGLIQKAYLTDENFYSQDKRLYNRFAIKISQAPNNVYNIASQLVLKADVKVQAINNPESFSNC